MTTEQSQTLAPQGRRYEYERVGRRRVHVTVFERRPNWQWEQVEATTMTPLRWRLLRWSTSTVDKIARWSTRSSIPLVEFHER